MIGGATDPGQRKSLTGGPKKLAEDFATQYKFVDTKQGQSKRTGGGRGDGDDHLPGGLGENSTLNPGASIGSFTRVAPWESKEFLASNSWDECYSNTGGGKGLSNEDPTYSFQELNRRQTHRAVYNNFLQESHTNRGNAKKQREHARIVAPIGQILMELIWVWQEAWKNHF